VACERRQRHRQPRKAVDRAACWLGHDRPSSTGTERLINRIIHKNPGDPGSCNTGKSSRQRTPDTPGDAIPRGDRLARG
jgi:hypothetical protein